MKIILDFAELHNPLFLAGTNHGSKLQAGNRDVVLVYDRTEKELLVFFNKKVAVIPSSNVASMTPKNPLDLEHQDEATQELKAQDDARIEPCKPTTAPSRNPRTAVAAAAQGVSQAKIQPPKPKAHTAQASTPTDHVFADAPGKVRD